MKTDSVADPVVVADSIGAAPEQVAQDDAEQMAFFATEPAQGMPANSQAEMASEAVEDHTVDSNGQPEQVSLFAESLGQRLTAARDLRGWGRAVVASKLHLPVHIVQMIETEQYDRIGHGIYLRGYLNSYARLVGVPTAAVDALLSTLAVAPPVLVASGRISHSRYLIQRYSGSAVYVILTAFIVVPTVMLGMNWGNHVGVRLTPLDVPASTSTAAQTDGADRSANAPVGKSAELAARTDASASSPTAVQPPAESPLMASFTPFTNPQRAPAPDTAQNAAVGSGQLVRLTLNEASWVEIVDGDGKRLEYATLPAGTVRSYSGEKPLDVRLGNTNGARFEVNGQAQDITPYNRGNVAHFKLSAAGKTISRSD